MAVTLDTTLGQILDDPQAKAVLDTYLPGVSSNPMIAMAWNMTLNMILAMPQAAQFGLTKEVANNILAEINKRIP
ncbi:MAG: hypothetical protein JXB15_08025 [Anaerolineales bacterium]|nr:hypothetical protein [Anaerolineales bacterium]